MTLRDRIGVDLGRLIRLEDMLGGRDDLVALAKKAEVAIDG
jgi:hypothetical protein